MGLTRFQKHYRKNKESRIKATRDYVRRQRLAVVELLGGECVKCSFNDSRALQIDHINGNGLKDKNLKGGSYYNRVIRSILNKENKYQLLCANCNWIKRAENHEFRKSKLID